MVASYILTNGKTQKKISEIIKDGNEYQNWNIRIGYSNIWITKVIEAYFVICFKKFMH